MVPVYKYLCKKVTYIHSYTKVYDNLLSNITFDNEHSEELEEEMIFDSIHKSDVEAIRFY